MARWIRRPAGIAVLVLLGLAVVIALSWYHVLPGGWFLRNLFEDPEARDARQRQEHRAERLESFAADPRGKLPGRVVFLGDLTIEDFPLERSFPGRPVINQGIDGERALELLERLRENLPPNPKGVVLYLGSVDFHLDETPGETLGEYLEKVLAALSATDPPFPVLVLGILPARDLDSVRIEALAAANTRLRTVADGAGQKFLDTGGPPLATPEGRLATESSRDRWHLNEAGYRELAERIKLQGGPVGELLR